MRRSTRWRKASPRSRTSTVLRLSPDRLLIGLAPDALAFLRVSHAARTRVSEKRTIPCDPAPGAEAWHGAAATLARLSGEIAKASARVTDRKSTRLNSSHLGISYAVFCLKKKNK